MVREEVTRIRLQTLARPCALWSHPDTPPQPPPQRGGAGLAASVPLWAPELIKDQEHPSLPPATMHSEDIALLATVTLLGVLLQGRPGVLVQEGGSRGWEDARLGWPRADWLYLEDRGRLGGQGGKSVGRTVEAKWAGIRPDDQVPN